MARAHEEAVGEIWGAAGRRPADRHAREELVVLASIVEKETGKADERTRVAGVFVNRLKKKMKLQSDPTILYGIYGGTAWQKPRTILKSDLDRPNPYSTYQIRRCRRADRQSGPRSAGGGGGPVADRRPLLRRRRHRRPHLRGDARRPQQERPEVAADRAAAQGGRRRPGTAATARGRAPASQAPETPDTSAPAGAPED